jgi:hypothetical protein
MSVWWSVSACHTVDCMENIEKFPLEQTLGALAECRKRSRVLEAAWKEERAVSKRLTLSLVTDYGYTLFKASSLSGHHRATIRVWLNAAGYDSVG